MVVSIAANSITAVRPMPCASSRGPKSRYAPSAAPKNSAKSVAIALISAATQSNSTVGREKCVRQFAGRLCPVAMPSFADRYCTKIAIRFAHSSTHSRV